MKYIILIMICCTIFRWINCQTCKPHPSGWTTAKVAVNSRIVIEISPHFSENRYKKGELHNITADVVEIFGTRNGLLNVSSVIRLGPVGNKKDCTKIKVDGASYIVFLQESSDADFYWIEYNPVKAVKSVSRSLRKVLCRGCSKAVSFRKASKTIKKEEGQKVKIKCKASGKPRASIVWYYNGTLLTSSNAPKDIKIKTRKKGGSSSLEIKSISGNYDGSHFICSATNIVSQANFTATLEVSNTAAQCETLCTETFDGFCKKGTCCFSGAKQPYCICPEAFYGKRCEKRNLAVFDRSLSVEEKHQQRLIAVLGMCLALMVVLFICMIVYCLFRNRRKHLHQSWSNGSANRSEAAPILSGHNNDDTALNAGGYDDEFGSRANNGASTQHLLYSIQTDGRQVNGSEVSSAAVLDEPHHPNPLPSGSFQHPPLKSRNSNNSTRSRLNGLAKSSPHRPSTKNADDMNHQQSSSLTPVLTSRRGVTEAGNSGTLDSKLSSHHDPVLPFNSGLLNIVKHQSNSSNVSKSQERVNDRASYKPSDRPVQLNVSSQHLPNTYSSFKNTVTTFSPDGNIRQENVHCGKDNLSVATSRSSISSNSNNSCNNTPHSPCSAQSSGASPCSISPETHPHTLSPGGNPHSSQTKTLFNHDDSLTYTHDGVPHINTVQTKLSCSDQDDPFVGMEIPDTSLGLYNNTPSQSLRKPTSLRKQNAIDSDGFQYPKPVTKLPYTSASVASAHLQQLPLLSRKTLSSDNKSEDSKSELSSELSDSDGRCSPQIEV